MFTTVRESVYCAALREFAKVIQVQYYNMELRPKEDWTARQTVLPKKTADSVTFEWLRKIYCYCGCFSLEIHYKMQRFYHHMGLISVNKLAVF